MNSFPVQWHTSILVVATLVGAWYLWRYLLILRVVYKAFSPPILAGGGTTPAYQIPAIPRIIWSYWHDPNPSAVVALCVKNWKRYASDHHIHLLHAGNLHEYIGDTPLPSNFNEMPEYRRADWLRAVLLRLHGGIWLDASIILTGPLDWVHSEQQARGSEFVGFYIDWMTQDSKRPIVENWFMASTQGSCFVVDWLEELEIAIVDEAAYLERLRREGLYDLAVQRMTGPEYLIMHVAVSMLQAKNPDRYRLVLHKAEDSAFYHLSRLRWNKKRLYVRLGFSPCPQQLPALIKLRGTERRIFERYLKRGWVLGRSAVGRYLLSSERQVSLDFQPKPEAEH